MKTNQKQIGWRVEWYNYYWDIETLILTDEEYQFCIAFDPDYYISAEKIELPITI